MMTFSQRHQTGQRFASSTACSTRISIWLHSRRNSARADGDIDAAQHAFEKAERVVELELAKWPDDAKTIMMLAFLYAALADKKMRCARDVARSDLCQFQRTHMMGRSRRPILRRFTRRWANAIWRSTMCCQLVIAASLYGCLHRLG
jgi:hypothetical protein